jgi:hypothetical protein
MKLVIDIYSIELVISNLKRNDAHLILRLGKRLLLHPFGCICFSTDYDPSRRTSVPKTPIYISCELRATRPTTAGLLTADPIGRMTGVRLTKVKFKNWLLLISPSAAGVPSPVTSVA